MPTPGKSRQQRANEAAQSRGFTNAYAERKARSTARGYSSPRTERTARENARGNPRDYALERERLNTLSRTRGFMNRSEENKFRKSGNPDKEKWQQARTLAYFGISKSKFDKIRSENRHYGTDAYVALQWSAINTYDLYRDKDLHNWSPDRVGYILSFNAAIVNPKTNYDSLKDNPKYVKGGLQGQKIMNASQFNYLVIYTNIYQVDEYEARYGTNSVSAGK